MNQVTAPTAANWLSQLAPAHAPLPSSLWPLAPGWWGIALLLVIAVAAGIYRHNRPAARIRRTALRELNELETKSIEENELARRLENLMRRFAVARFGREQVANLAGRQWIAFVVDNHGRAFEGRVGTEFLSAAWGKQGSGERERWIQGARSFIKEKL